VLHMAPCTGRAEVIMAFYQNSFVPVKCSGEIEKWPLERLALPIEKVITYVIIADYRCEDGRFLVSATCVAFSNPDSLSSSET
jgi:hypothetical protein